MSTTPITIPSEFDRLSRSEKLAFIDALCERVEGLREEDVVLSAEQEQELQRRWERYQADPSVAEPWDAVRAELLAD